REHRGHGEDRGGIETFSIIIKGGAALHVALTLIALLSLCVLCEKFLRAIKEGSPLRGRETRASILGSHGTRGNRRKKY
ncbi:MAG: hypothetical protein AB1798_10990, partial [Spirochaetota bacterium]